MKSFVGYLLILFLLPCGAVMAEPDFTSADGVRLSCAGDLQQLPAATPKAQQAWVLCRDLATLRRLWHLSSGHPEYMQDKFKAFTEKVLQGQYLSLLEEVRMTRKVLEKIELRHRDDGLVLVPATWGSDLDGDGKLTLEEQYLFAIPKRQSASETEEPAEKTAAYYQENYALDARFRIDQSDVQWLLGYHYFLEAGLELSLALAEETDEAQDRPLRVRDPAALLRSHQLLLAAVKNSDRLRQMVAAETDDEDEWIAHAGQPSSVFPVPLTKGDFQVWQQLIEYVLPVLEGRHLLGGGQPKGFIDSLFANMCPQGQGINVPLLFRQEQHATFIPSAPSEKPAACQPVTSRQPSSALLRYLEEPLQRSRDPAVGLAMLRKLLWVN